MIYRYPESFLHRLLIVHFATVASMFILTQAVGENNNRCSYVGQEPKSSSSIVSLTLRSSFARERRNPSGPLDCGRPSAPASHASHYCEMVPVNTNASPTTNNQVYQWTGELPS